MGGGQPVRLPPPTGLAALGLSNSALHAFVAAMKVVVAAGVSAPVPSPAPSVPTRKVATLPLLHLRFSYRLALDGDLPPICEAANQVKKRVEGSATLNQALTRGLPFCCWVFGKRAHFSTSLPLLGFVKMRAC